MTKETDLHEFWDEVQGGPIPETPERKVAREHPGDLVIATSKNRVLVRIHPDGQLTFSPDYTPDEAAVTFWTAMAQRRIGSEERLAQFAIYEELIRRVGEADLSYERAQQRARAEGATEHDRHLEEISLANLESRVHQLIEVGRGVAVSRS